VFLWAWTGTPFATLDAQRSGWGERVNPFALVDQGRLLVRRLSHSNLPWVVSPAADLVGAIVLVLGVALLLKRPRRVSVAAIAWTLGVGFLALVSEGVSTNPRMLITAFPAMVVFARCCTGKRYTWLLSASALLLVGSSWLTYGGHTLTP
jgi:hypothetical protein